jgi:hypothetical protein
MSVTRVEAIDEAVRRSYARMPELVSGLADPLAFRRMPVIAASTVLCDIWSEFRKIMTEGLC